MLFKKLTALILSCLVVCSFSACSNSKKDEGSSKEKSEAEINKQYEEVMDEINSDAQKTYDGLSFNAQAFSSSDYSFYPPSDEAAVFSLEKNSFVKIDSDGSYFNTISPGNQTLCESEVYKTAKGLTVGDNAMDFISAYAIEDGKALYGSSGSYTPMENSAFLGRLTAVYGSKSNGEFAHLGEADIRKFLKIRDENADGMYFDPKLVNDAFSQFDSLAVLDITIDEHNTVTQIVVYRFEKTPDSGFTH